MNIIVMIVTCLNIILLLGLSFHVFIRVKEKKEDQRITKGLQLLQHKIAILQDLSDKADEQVQRLVHVLDNKSTELRRTTAEANKAMSEIQIGLSQISDSEMQTAESRAGQISDNIKLDEFSQFVQALNQQNEKTKPTTQVIPNAKNIPQDFIATTEPTKNQVRPFEFRRIGR